MSTPDLDAIRKQWLAPCGPCDAGLAMQCTHPDADERPVIAALCDEVEKLRTTPAALCLDDGLGVRWGGESEGVVNDRARDAAMDTLRKVNDRLAAVPYRWSGGLPYVEREHIFAAVNEVARELLGKNWWHLMRGEEDE